ncbi:hypothetical protein [uncultured Cytophaga sp.]|uniref:hypothetical protein n=1 Tax=uncultured Cytophaga sp. TaxID=160238 RepID=UPI00260D5EDE|nr:hypothetical protein [uncultured Cytophaga sp.]
MKTDSNFFEEIHAREQKSKKRSWMRQSFTFKHGLAIGALCMIGILIIGSFRAVNPLQDSIEMLSLHLDSIQIQQNERIIQLLEVSSKRDTTIIHIVAPAF